MTAAVNAARPSSTDDTGMSTRARRRHQLRLAAPARVPASSPAAMPDAPKYHPSPSAATQRTTASIDWVRVTSQKWPAPISSPRTTAAPTAGSIWRAMHSTAMTGSFVTEAISGLRTTSAT